MWFFTRRAETLQNARVGYEAAVQLWVYMGSETWSRFNVLLVANSVMMAAIAVLVTGPQEVGASNRSFASFAIFAGLLGYIGLWICRLWWWQTNRDYDYHHYYLDSAKELEEQYLWDPVRTVSRGASFSQNSGAALSLGGHTVTRSLSKGPTSREIALWMIRVFTIVYVLAVVFSLIRLAGF